MENTKISEYSTKSINKVSYTFTDIEPDNSIRVKAPQLVRKATSDSVIVEQPLQITLTWLEQGLVKNKIFTITMRTPGDDYALIVGLLHSEGVTQQFTDIESITMDTREVDGEGSQNEWLVEFSNGITPDLGSLDRYLMTYSSCGLCGSTSLKALQLKTQQNLSFTEHKNLLAANSLLSLSKKMRSEQGVFELTGGVHGAALFDSQINLRHSFEDIGRHNAVDKVIGKYLLAKQSESKMANITKKPISNLHPLWILLVSGRISFEIVQKTIMAGISVLVGVGAPSDLAIQAARRFDLTLIGFVSEKGFNVYHGDWRLNNDYVN
jgi:FdhD protein